MSSRGRKPPVSAGLRHESPGGATQTVRAASCVRPESPPLGLKCGVTSDTGGFRPRLGVIRPYGANGTGISSRAALVDGLRPNMVFSLRRLTMCRSAQIRSGQRS